MNSKNDVALITTVFPDGLNYLADFFSSLSKQTFRDFDILLLNDGVLDLKDHVCKYPELNIIEKKVSGTISENRLTGINLAKNRGYEYLVFGDSDDYFSQDRFEVIIDWLGEHDIIVNELSLFDAAGVHDHAYFSERINNGAQIDWDFIKNRNIFGFTNSAIRLSIVDQIYFPSDLVAVDWFFFTKLLLQGCNAVFTSDAVSFYRQYPGNVSGIGRPLEQILGSVLSVKLQHYRYLQSSRPVYETFFKNIDNISETMIDEIMAHYDGRKLFWWELPGE